METNIAKERVLTQLLENISKKLDELIELKQDIATLKEKIESIEEMLIEELTDEEKSDMLEAMEEYAKGKTISLAEAEKALGI